MTRRSRSTYIVLGSSPDGVDNGYGQQSSQQVYGSSPFPKGVVCIPLPCSLMMDGPSMTTVRGEARAREEEALKEGGRCFGCGNYCCSFREKSVAVELSSS